MNEELQPTALIGALSGEVGLAQLLELPAFLGHAAKGEPTEARANVAVLDVVELATMKLQLADPNDEHSDWEVSATLPDGAKPALWRAAACIYPVGELAGHELAHRLKAKRVDDAV